MPLFRKKPVVIEATQWFKNGDHPQDNVGESIHDEYADETFPRLEGKVVRFFRRPEVEFAGQGIHEPCGKFWANHGWIDTSEGGHTVCPGDWIITDVGGATKPEHGHWYYPCKPDIFAATYDAVGDDETVLVADGVPVSLYDPQAAAKFING